MKRTNPLAALTLAAAAVVTFDAAAAAPPIGELDPVTISAAKTQADHEAIAAAYDAEAVVAEKKAKLHEAMLRSYQTPGTKPYMAVMVTHCKALTKQYTEAAKLNRDMATEHRKIAAALP